MQLPYMIATLPYMIATFFLNIRSLNIGLKDSKTLLQEHMHSLGEELPKYITKKLSGPPHKPKFEVICKINTLRHSVSCIAATVQEGQQTVSKIILEKIHGKK